MLRAVGSRGFCPSLSTESDKGAYHTAIHIQRIPDNRSAWAGDRNSSGSGTGIGSPCVAVSEVGTLSLFGSGLFGVGGLLMPRPFNRSRKEVVQAAQNRAGTLNPPGPPSTS